jgi:mannose-6-phosphate isomerase
MRIRPALKNYDWGDTSTIPALLGMSASGQPVAEAWFGTHPAGEATLDDGRPLSALVGRLPFMVKFIAAGSPLSLQVHPSLAQARDGFARENAAGIAIDDPRRNYRDDSDKPELLVALTPFSALCGFHDPSATAGWFRALGWTDLADALDKLGIESFVREALTGDTLAVPAWLPAWAADLRDAHPGDPAILVALLMHWVELAPGECLALEAGVLHAYLRGAAVEVMNGSDNVVRAGFTSKHRDREELLRITSFEPVASPVKRPDNGLYPSTGSYRLVAHPAGSTIRADQTTIIVTSTGESHVLVVGESMKVERATAFAATAGTPR